MTGAAIHYSRSMTSSAPTIILVAAALVLLSVIPFRAYHRSARMRVFAACAGYTAASAIAAALALNALPGASAAFLLALPVMGAVLTTWAYLTRNRNRVSGLIAYHQN